MGNRAATYAALLFTTVLVSLLLGAAPAVAAPGKLPEAPKGFLGVSGRHLDTNDLDEMERAGVGMYRTLFHFSVAKRTPKGFYDWSDFDRLVGRTASRGIQVLPLLYGTPRWIYPDGSTPPIYHDRAREAWAALLRQLVGRYGPRGRYWYTHPLVPYRPITAWQIWNEPNSDNFWEREPDPVEYAKLAAISAAAIHSVDPKATIVGAGLVHEPEGAGVPGPEYLAAVAALPAARAAIDKWAYHPYAWNAPGVRTALRQARLVLKAHDPGAPVWVTEVGWGSDFRADRMLHKTPAGQAKALKNTFAMAIRKRHKLGIQRVLWYYWRDHTDPFCIWCRSAGLLDNSYAPKPAFTAFRAIARR